MLWPCSQTGASCWAATSTLWPMSPRLDWASQFGRLARQQFRSGQRRQRQTVYSVSLQTDGGIILGGIFSSTTRLAASPLPVSWLTAPWTPRSWTQPQHTPGLITFHYDGECGARTSSLPAAPQDGTHIAGGFTRVGGGFTAMTCATFMYATRIVGGQPQARATSTLASRQLQRRSFGQIEFLLDGPHQGGHLGAASARRHRLPSQVRALRFRMWTTPDCRQATAQDNPTVGLQRNGINGVVGAAAGSKLLSSEPSELRRPIEAAADIGQSVEVAAQQDAPVWLQGRA